LNAKEWVAAYAEQLGADTPSAQEWSVILDLAGEAAHASERIAAPLACWVAAKAGVEADQALAAARKVAADG
jgi:hypothetical protein